MPFPLVFGFGVMTATSGLAKSGQSRTPFGFPFRTTNTMVDVYGRERLGNSFSQPSSISPALRTASVSVYRASVTTSAGRPSFTARA